MEFSQIKASFTQQAFRVLPGAVLPHLRQQLPQDHVYGSSVLVQIVRPEYTLFPIQDRDHTAHER